MTGLLLFWVQNPRQAGGAGGIPQEGEWKDHVAWVIKDKHPKLALENHPLTSFQAGQGPMLSQTTEDSRN